MCNEFPIPISVRNWISFQCFLSPAYCLFKKHRYINYEKKGVYTSRECQDQFSVDSCENFQAKKKNNLVSGNMGDKKNLHPGYQKFTLQSKNTPKEPDTFL